MAAVKGCVCVEGGGGGGGWGGGGSDISVKYQQSCLLASLNQSKCPEGHEYPQPAPFFNYKLFESQ